LRIVYVWEIRRSLLPFNWCDQSVSAARERLNILRMIRRVAEGSPENPDSHIDAMVKLDDGVIWPKPFSYFLTGYNLTSSFDEHSQNLKWLLPENGFAIAIFYSCRVELTGTEIDLKCSEPDTTCSMIVYWHLELRAEKPFPLKVKRS